MNLLQLSSPAAGIRRHLVTLIGVSMLPVLAIAWEGMPGELAVALVSLAAGSILAWQAARQLTVPIARLREEVGQLSRSGYARRVPIDGPVEIRALAQDFNGMAAMIENSRQQLEQSEQRFRELTELSSDWYWETGADHRFTFVSPGAERFFGSKVEELIGRARWEIDYVGVTAADWELHRAGLDRGKAFEDLRLSRRTPSGMVVHFSISGRPVYDADGRFCGYRGVGHDVTAEVRGRDALRAERDLLSRVIETMAEGVVIFDAEGRYVRMNAVAERIFGASRRQLRGRTLREVPVRREPFTLGDAELRECVFWRLREGEPQETAKLFYMVRPDRTRVLVSRNATRLEDGNGCFEGVVATFEDITDRARSEERNRLFLSSTRDGFWVINREGHIEEVNEAMCRLLGMADRELLGKRVCDVLPGIDESAMLRQIERAVSERHLRFESEILRPDGERAVFEVNATYVDVDGGRIYAFFHDVTERKRHEALLVSIARGVSTEVGEAFFRSLVERLAQDLGADYAFVGELTGPAGDRLRTLAFVGDGRIRPNFEYALQGTPCVNAIKQRGTVIYPSHVADLFPDDADLKKLDVEGYVGTSLFGADGRALGILVVMNRKAIERGSFWASMIKIFGVRAGAEIERARAEARILQINESLDQAVRQRTAQLEEANRELESFNYSISHDLRQPLAAIAGFADMLHENPELVPEAVREIATSAARMEEIIDALLRLSRAARGELRHERVDVNALVGDVVRDLPHDGRAEVVIGELPAASGDPALLRQVWVNLIGNAIKYSSRNPAPRVDISAETRNGHLEYAVRDNGIGFDTSDGMRLFEPFRRLRSAEGFDGSGIGLAIAQAIVRRHGGSIRATSAPGRGAVFRFSLPEQADAHRPAHAIHGERP